MSTNADIISDALREIGVLPQGKNASADQGKEGLRTLNRMLAAWKANHIDIGYYKQSSTTADCPIPEWTELAVVNSLAVFLAPHYGRQVSMELAGKANGGYEQLLRESVIKNREESDMSHIPGQRGRYNINTDQ